MCGVIYSAPEVLDEDTLEYGKSVDLWSLGCILYTLLTCDVPFDGTGVSSVKYSIRNEDRPELPANLVDSEIEFLIDRYVLVCSIEHDVGIFFLHF